MKYHVQINWSLFEDEEGNISDDFRRKLMF
jgi:hypothetical protein